MPRDEDVGGERDDEGVDAEADDEEAVERADDDADRRAPSRATPGRTSHAGSSASPPPAPPVPKISATTIAASAITDSIDRSMWPAISVSDRPTAMMPTKVDCSRMLRKMPICRKFGIVAEKTASDDDQDEPDEVVEDELDRDAAARRDGGGRVDGVGHGSADASCHPVQAGSSNHRRDREASADGPAFAGMTADGAIASARASGAEPSPCAMP